VFGEYWKCLLTRKKGDLYVFKADVTIKAPAEIYVPSTQYPYRVAAIVEGGRFKKVGNCILVYTKNSGKLLWRSAVIRIKNLSTVQEARIIPLQSAILISRCGRQSPIIHLFSANPRN